MRGVETRRERKSSVSCLNSGLLSKANVIAIRFDMMSARLYKTYVNLSNIVLRISDGTERGKSSAVLINSHLDSTLPSPGAADDALAVGVMIECARVLIETKGWEPTYSVIFREF